jgi:hypothetical protein
MRFPGFTKVVLLAFVPALWPHASRAEAERDYVFTDLEGHLVVRFAGTAATGLNASQVEELVNAELSSMVHDRLRADLLFEAEPAADPGWATSMERRLEQHVPQVGFEVSGVSIECRAASCRLILEQPTHFTVPEHQAVLEEAQKYFEAFIAAHRQHFEPVFMITAYDQEPETPHIKVFLRRSFGGAE